MITKDNEPINQMSDGDYIVRHGPYRYVVRDSDAGGAYKKAEVEAYLAEHPEALVPEPAPPPPTQEELDRWEEQTLLAYLASTDWCAIRLAETHIEMPAGVVEERAAARARISELRGQK